MSNLNLLRRTPRLSKKKNKPIEEEKVDMSTTEKIMHEIKSHFQKDKNSEVRKSKKKNKKENQAVKIKVDQPEPIEDLPLEIKEELETQGELLEVINEVLCKRNENHLEVDSKDVSEYSSTSDYSYNRLEDSRESSDLSSEENLVFDPPEPTKTPTKYKRSKKVERLTSTASTIITADTSHPAIALRKVQSLTRKNSTSEFFKGFFRKSKSENNDGRNEPPKLIKANSVSEGRSTSLDIKLSRKSSTSIKRKISNLILMSDSQGRGNLKRSSSIRDFMKKSKEDNGKSTNLWSTSLQSLVENDIAVSYHDLSFINYDALNTCSYDSKNENVDTGRQLLRSQSVSVQNVYHRVTNNRLSLASEDSDRCCQSTLDLSFTSEPASLPSLHQLEGGHHASPGTVHRYRRRVESAVGDDPQVRLRNGSTSGNTANSFRSSGSGCSKLRRQNACRQVRRDSTPGPDRNVRSRSLNHLDTLDQSIRPSSESLTDPAEGQTPTNATAAPGTDSVAGSGSHAGGYSRSESDCSMARPQERLLTVPPPDSGAVANERTQRTTARRQMLSRSQVSSSEYFSVSFELGEDSSVIHGREEFLPATKGTSLGDALAKVCERRSIDLATCDVYIDGCRSQTSVVLNQETSALGGKTIRITAKELGNKKTGVSNTQFRKPSGSYKGKTSGLFFSTSTEDSTSNLSNSTTLLLQDSRTDFDQSKKQSKQRWSGFFGNNKDTRMESLVDQLNHYSRHGVPDSEQNSIAVDEEIIQALYTLEDDWRQLADPSELTERQQQQQTAIWELISTEVAFIKTLRVVTGLFLSCLKSLQSNHILTEIDTDKLFSNITEIRECNTNFWSMCLYPAVVKMRTTREPISPVLFLDSFLHMRDTYHSYFRYCAEQARCQHYCRDNHAHNEVFTAYLAWCETQKECNRLRLMDILVRPMQRLTKYGLLIKAILKNTDDEIEKDCLLTMLKSVDDFVNSVNSCLRQKQDNERLRGIMLRIESYDVVETKDDDILAMVQRHNQLDLSQPMPGCPPDRKRHLLLEGDLKLKDSSTSKMEVHCFLLTDILLICKPSSKKGGALMRVIRPPYLVDRIILQELNRETPSLALIYLNEFKTASAAFILQNNDQKKLKTWAECIRKAQTLYEQAKQTPVLGLTRQLSSSVPGDEYLEQEYNFEYCTDYGDSHSLQSLIPRSPLASSSRASRVSSLAHSHSGSVEMNDQSSIGSTNNQSRGISIENENRTASISSDEGVQPLPADKSPINQKNSLKQRLFNATPKTLLTPNTLSVQPYGNLGQSLPNLTLGSPNVGTLNLSPNQNTLLVPTTKNGQHLLSPNQRGISYPPPSPTRGNLRRGFAITQSKNPPLIKTGHVNSTAGAICTAQEPTNFDFDVPVIAGVSPPDDVPESFNRGQHRQAMLKRIYRSDNRRYHTAGVVDDIKKSDEKDTSIQKRLSWNCGASDQPPQTPSQPEDHAT